MYYKNFYTRSDSIFNDHCYFNLANFYLQNLSLNVVNLAVAPGCISDNHHTFPVRWNKVNFLEIYHDEVSVLYPKAADNNHMGEEGQIVYANMIYNKLFYNNNKILE